MNIWRRKMSTLEILWTCRILCSIDNIQEYTWLFMFVKILADSSFFWWSVNWLSGTSRMSFAFFLYVSLISSVSDAHISDHFLNIAPGATLSSSEKRLELIRHNISAFNLFIFRFYMAKYTAHVLHVPAKKATWNTHFIVLNIAYDIPSLTILSHFLTMFVCQYFHSESWSQFMLQMIRATLDLNTGVVMLANCLFLSDKRENLSPHLRPPYFREYWPRFFTFLRRHIFYEYSQIRIIFQLNEKEDVFSSFLDWTAVF